MSESFRERRKRELQGNSVQTKNTGMSYREQRKKELNPDVTVSNTEELPSIQPDYLKPRQDTSSLMSGPQALKSFAESMPKTQTNQEWLDQEAAARDKQLGNAPGFIKKPLQFLGSAIDHLQTIPGVSNFQQGAGHTLGVEAQTAPLNNGLVGKTAGVIGSMAGYGVNPAQIEQNLFNTGYGVANKLVGTKLGQKAVQATQGGVSRLANLANPVLNRAGINIGSNLTNKVGERVKTGGIANAIQNTGLEASKGNTDLKDLGTAAALGGAFGAAGDVAFHGAAAALSNIFKRNGLPEKQVQEILALPMGREDAARLRRAPQNGSNGVVTPEYTFGLPEPRVNAPVATNARIAQRANPWREKYNQLIGLAHETKFTPGRESEELEQLWSSIAGKNDPSLDDLVKLAHPTYFSKVKPGLASKAKGYQAAREVAGAPLPIKGSERIPQGTIAEAAPLTQKIGRAPNVEPRRLETANPEPAILHANTDGVQNYAGNRMAFRQGATQGERTINRNQVVNNLRKNLGVIIDTGRLSGGRNVLGNYKIKPEVVRTRMAEDLQVISHEVGHHFDKKMKLSNDPAFHTELEAVARNNPSLNISAYQPHQIPSEGVAEYARLRLTDPDLARQLAPNFTKYFDATLGPKMLKGLEASAKDMDTWITQGDFNQAKGLIDFTSGEKKNPFSWDKTYTKFLDDLNPLKLVEKALKGKIGIGNESIYKMARLSRGVAERAKLAIKRGIYDDQGNRVGDGLAQIVKPLERMGVNEKEFSTYLAVRHAMDLKAMGKQVPFDDAQIKAVMNKLDSPEMQSVQQGVLKFNNHLLDILVDAQILTKEAVTAMRQKYPNYVPFMRYFDDDAIAGFKNGGFGAGKGFANIANPIKSMSEEGSTRTIINPIESIIKNTMLVMNAAAKNKVGLQLADLSKIEGAGAWVESLGKGGASPGEHVISVHENGVKQSYKVRDPELYNAMLSLDAESTNSLIKFLGASASLLRAGAVLTPEFTIRNAFRDIIGATINSTQYGFNPVDFAKGMFHVLGRTKTFDQFLSSGGAMSTMMSLDRDANREAMEAVFRKSLKDKTMNIVTSPKELAKMLSGYTPVKTVVGGLRKAAEVSELSTKVGAFNKTLKKTGSLEEAAYTARDLMDFNRAGTNIRQANRAVAFLNAALQGTDKMVRAFKHNPASFITRSFVSLVLPSIGLYYYNKSLSPEMQQKYENIPQWQKDNFFLIGIPGLGEFARLPKPFEAGMLFSTGTERMMRYFEGNDPEAFKDYGRTVLQTFTPPVMITALTPIMEAITNYSFFRGGPIANQGDMRFEKKDQYGLYTSETAKGIGKILSHTPLKESNFASPKIIDNTIKGYTAGLGQYAVTGVDAAINAASGGKEVPLPAKKITEQPFVKAFFASSGGGGQVRDEFYNAWSKISAKKASADKNETPFRDPTYSRMNYGKKVIDKLNKQYKLIQNAKDMSATEKRTRLDILDQQMNEVAGKSLGK